MSNKVTIQPTKFVDLPNGDESVGVRVFDNYDSQYENNWESIPDGELEILREVVESQTFRDFLDYMEEKKVGCFIGENWHDWDDIKHIVEGSKENP